MADTRAGTTTHAQATPHRLDALTQFPRATPQAWPFFLFDPIYGIQVCGPAGKVAFVQSLHAGEAAVPNKTIICAQIGAKRPRYFEGRLLTRQDFEFEQQYIDRQLRHLARATLGVGIVEGLVVSATATSIAVSPGLAVDPLGRLVELTDTCTAALPATSGAWDVLLELDYEPCDPGLALGLDEDAAREATMQRDVVRLLLAETEPFADRGDSGNVVWLGRVRATRGAIEIDRAKRCAKDAAGT